MATTGDKSWRLVKDEDERRATRQAMTRVRRRRRRGATARAALHRRVRAHRYWPSPSDHVPLPHVRLRLRLCTFNPFLSSSHSPPRSCPLRLRILALASSALALSDQTRICAHPLLAVACCGKRRQRWGEGESEGEHMAVKCRTTLPSSSPSPSPSRALALRRLQSLHLCWLSTRAGRTSLARAHARLVQTHSLPQSEGAGERTRCAYHRTPKSYRHVNSLFLIVHTSTLAVDDVDLTMMEVLKEYKIYWDSSRRTNGLVSAISTLR